MDTIKSFLKIILLLSIATAVASLLFPIIWPMVQTVTDYQPDRVFRRVWMIAIIIGLLGWGKEIGLRNPQEVGYVLHRDGFRNAVVGVLVSWIFLGCLTVLYFQLGFWQWQPQIQSLKVFQKFGEGLLQGAAVAGIEEYLFRGMIFLSLSRHCGWVKAAIVSSLLFSSLHFIEGKGSASAIQDSFAWYSGFAICAEMLVSMVGRFQWFPAATGLFLVGLSMCFATERTKNLWYAAGLHGGWVCYFRVCPVFTLYLPEYTFWTGGSRLFDGVIPIAGMVIIFPVTYWLIQMGFVRSTVRIDSALARPESDLETEEEFNKAV